MLIAAGCQRIESVKETYLYVTGANAAYFPLVATLLGSFETFVPHSQLMVCDFGLTEGQARFFANLGILLPKPDDILPHQHPYYYKACVGHYIKDLDFDVLVWIDSDCVIVGPITQFLSQYLATVDPKQEAFLACPDSAGKTIAEFVATFPDPNEPFVQNKLAQLPGAYQESYLSAGLFAIRSRSVLAAYHETVQITPPHFLYDQNILNYLVYKNALHVIKLNWMQWNISGPYLNDLVVDTSGGVLAVRHGHDRVWNIHLSDGKEQTALKLTLLNIEIEGQYLLGLLREPVHPLLKELTTLFLSRFLLNNPTRKRLLLESGALLPENPAQSGIPIPDNPAYKLYLGGAWKG